MGWWSSLFPSSANGGSSGSSRRAQAMSSTRDAFTLPSSSPTFPELDGDASFDPESAASPAFTYPPNSGTGAYDSVPTTAGTNWTARRQRSSILPLHNQPQPSAQPAIARTWSRIRTWLENEYPELGDTLNYGILPQNLADIEIHFGFPLPQAVRDSYLIVDGQEAESSAPGFAQGLFCGLYFLPLDDVLDEWRFWRDVDQDPATGANVQLQELMQSIPPGWVQRAYSSRGWIPLVTDRAGNYLGVDLAPDQGGTAGQVIVFGRDFDTKVVMWRGEGADGWAQWLQSFAEELESGENFAVGGISDTSDSSEDDVGYEGYFFDAAGGGIQNQGGGGELGSHGMKLTGEYKGWNVLEAWADRSLKRWRQAGVDLEGTPLPEHIRPVTNGKLPSLGPDMTRGVEVPIPVFSVDGTPETPKAFSAPTASMKKQTDDYSPTTVVRKDLPKIAVTKAPAPLPVELPTAYDIVPSPSPPDSRTSSLDIESGGGGPFMTETAVPTSIRPNENGDANGDADPLSPRTADPMLVKEPETPDYIGGDVSGMEDSIPIQPTPSTPNLVIATEYIPSTSSEPSTPVEVPSEPRDEATDSALSS